MHSLAYSRSCKSSTSCCHMQALSTCPHLVELSVNGTALTDAGLLAVLGVHGRDADRPEKFDEEQMAGYAAAEPACSAAEHAAEEQFGDSAGCAAPGVHSACRSHLAQPPQAADSRPPTALIPEAEASVAESDVSCA